MDQWRSLVPEPAPFTADPERAEPLNFAPDDPECLRIDALQWHAQAVAGWHRDAVFAQVPGEPLPWQRGDLVWALSRGDRPWGPAAFHVPAMIAQEAPVAWLAECAAALAAIAAQLGDGLLAGRYRAALARLGTDLPGSDHRLGGDGADHRFSTAVYPVLARLRDDPATLAALEHTRSLTKPVPTKAWLRRAEGLLAVSPRVPAAMRDVLDTLLSTRGAVDDDQDGLLRGVSWLAAAEPGEEVSGLLARGGGDRGRAVWPGVLPTGRPDRGGRRGDPRRPARPHPGPGAGAVGSHRPQQTAADQGRRRSGPVGHGPRLGARRGPGAGRRRPRSDLGRSAARAVRRDRR
ncbi:hypothetical protein Q0Z83_057570 [Actinoplanes sichuanensis]|uniref:Uncharacterized protein n=1 Tax=Actinoplanes sichuanensis TaxID=512349 RepID=A0ABW4A5T8_9ACTN|nr:hypothetical protein [Actinoplanes sichuanensis]BEL07566.1 hypothetical protein Q0Z83_057570 [Actinoplanes sichuanensis]